MFNIYVYKCTGILYKVKNNNNAKSKPGGDIIVNLTISCNVINDDHAHSLSDFVLWIPLRGVSAFLIVSLRSLCISLNCHFLKIYFV